MNVDKMDLGLIDEFNRLKLKIAESRHSLIDKLWKRYPDPVSSKEFSRDHPDMVANLLYQHISELKREIEEYNSIRAGEGTQRFVFKLPPAEGRDGYRLSVEDRGHGLLPSDVRWQPFVWSTAGQDRPRSIPIHTWLPRKSDGFTKVLFDLDKPWEPPPGFSGYEKHRQNVLSKLLARDPNVFDGYVWRVQNVEVSTGDTLVIKVQPCRFADYHSTCLSLDERITLDNGAQTNIKGWLAPKWRKGTLQSFYPGAGNLAVNVLLITKDGSAIMVQQSEFHSVSKLEWVASVSGTVRLRGDSESITAKDHYPDPRRTAYNETNEETGIEIPMDRLKWIGFGMGMKMGTPCLLAEVEVDRSEAEAVKDFEHREDKHETKSINFVPLKSERVLEVLNDQSNFKHRTYFELGLALALIRRGMAERT